MLSKEEQEAIEYAQGLVNLYNMNIPLNYTDYENDTIRILLNIIKKLQNKDIEEE